MKSQVKQLDFTGKTIYCGIDVHKTSWKGLTRFSANRAIAANRINCLKAVNRIFLPPTLISHFTFRKLYVVASPCFSVAGSCLWKAVTLFHLQ